MQNGRRNFAPSVLGKCDFAYIHNPTTSLSTSFFIMRETLSLIVSLLVLLVNTETWYTVVPMRFSITTGLSGGVAVSGVVPVAVAIAQNVCSGVGVV